MTNIEVKHLFTHRRFPNGELKRISLLLYLPVGLILFIFRSILALGVVLLGCASDAPVVHKFVSKVAALSLGISVSVENPEKKEDVEIYVSNCRSVLDNLAVHIVTGSVSPGPKMHPVLSRGIGIHYFGAQTNMETFKKNIALLLSEKKIPVYFAPEGKITNGRALLKFQTYPFSLTSKVQPICVSIERPFVDIAISTIGSAYWADVFYYMFSPTTHYRLRFLTSVEKQNLTDEKFAFLARESISKALKIATPDLGCSDLIEYEKREIVEQHSLQNVEGLVDREVKRMALQVKDVLPHVPLSVIQKDLSKTKNVDATITNILEGRVRFIPETSQLLQPSTSSSGNSFESTVSTSVTPSVSASAHDFFNTAASTFAKNAEDRNKSFQERKEQLIANARKRYIDKHNLTISFH